MKNPLDTDFTFTYDLLPHTVPAGQTKDMERYLVRRFIWGMMGHIYNQFASKAMQENEAKFERMHPDTISDPYIRNTQIYDKIKRVDDPLFQEQVVKDCILGVVSKFGRDRVLPQIRNAGQVDPNTPLYMSLIDKFSTQIDETPAQQQPAMQQEPLLG